MKNFTGTASCGRICLFMEKQEKEIFLTRLAFVLTWMFNTPFWAVYNMLPFILHKDLKASVFQVTLMIALKPLVALFSMYWSAWIKERQDLLAKNIMWGTCLGHLPFFFFPFVDNPWFFIFSFGFYMFMARGMGPAWMEILKLNVPKSLRERTFAFASSFEYLGAGIFPLLIGWALDHYEQPWRWIFPWAAGVALVALFFQRKIPLKKMDVQQNVLSLKGSVLKPWKNAWQLLCMRPDFMQFQVGFMLGGAGLVIMQPALPKFFLDHLQLSYMEVAVAVNLCKGIGFALSSSFWAKKIQEIDIFKFCSFITLLAAFFPVLLVISELYLPWIYLAYFVYGIMQAGSTLSWNLSGPIFSQQEDSSVYSSVNVMAVGLRGCIAPLLGAILAKFFGADFVMILGTVFCVFATLHMSAYSQSDERSKEIG